MIALLTYPRELQPRKAPWPWAEVAYYTRAGRRSGTPYARLTARPTKTEGLARCVYESPTLTLRFEQRREVAPDVTAPAEGLAMAGKFRVFDDPLTARGMKWRHKVLTETDATDIYRASELIRNTLIVRTHEPEERLRRAAIRRHYCNTRAELICPDALYRNAEEAVALGLTSIMLRASMPSLIPD